MKSFAKRIIESLQDKTHQFDDSLYQSRSKTFGSYLLRKNYSKHLSQGASISFFFFIFSMVSWLLVEQNFDFAKKQEISDIIDFESFDITLPPIPAELLKPRLSSAEKIEEIKPKEEKPKSEMPKVVAEDPKVQKDVSKKNETTQKNESEDGGGKSLDTLAREGNSKKGDTESEKKSLIEPIGGINEFVLYVQKNVKYPDDALKYKISGTVYVFFVVNELGKIEDVKFTKKLGYGIEEEIARVMSNAPDWKPFLINGVPQKNKVHVPIKLNLP